jgi:hypothetical protein
MPEQLKFGAGLLARIEEMNARLGRAMRSGALDDLDREILAVLASHKGAAAAIKAEAIAGAVGKEWSEKTRREITAAVEHLVVFHKLPIGARRGVPPGYFLIMNQNDLDLAIHPLWCEHYAILRRLRALTGKAECARLFGQQMLDLDKEDAA